MSDGELPPFYAEFKNNYTEYNDKTRVQLNVSGLMLMSLNDPNKNTCTTDASLHFAILLLLPDT